MLPWIAWGALVALFLALSVARASGPPARPKVAAARGGVAGAGLARRHRGWSPWANLLWLMAVIVVAWPLVARLV